MSFGISSDTHTDHRPGDRSMLNVPMQWIGVSILCLIGIAIVHGVTATRQKDPQSEPGQAR